MAGLNKIRVYARIMQKDKITDNIIMEMDDFTRGNFFDNISVICQKMDLSTPVILEKHIQQMGKFNHSVFLPNEFIENVSFSQFVVERIEDEEEKDKKKFFECFA